jgi:hypothetical protein
LADLQAQKITMREFSEAVNISVRTLHFWKRSPEAAPAKRGRKTPPPNRLSASEKQEIVDVLLKPEWVDLSPREIYYKLLDEDLRLIASPATFYRIAHENNL